MAEENGKKNGVGLIDRVRQDITDLKETIKEKGKDEIEGLKEPEKSQVFRSIFRVKHDETARNRALSVLSNVFFHLHPAKVNRDAVKYKFTWGMGGITFYLFIVLTFTAAQHASLGRPLDDHRGLAAHVPCLPYRLLQAPPRI
jgi:hypothetical protein